MVLQSCFSSVSIRALTYRAKQHGRGYTPPVFDDPQEGGGFQPEFVFDQLARLGFNITTFDCLARAKLGTRLMASLPNWL